MAAHIIGITGLTFGLTQETGVIAITFNRSVNAAKVEIADEDGDIVAVGYHGFKAEYSISAVYKTGGLGLAGAVVGTQLTLANAVDGNGVSGGTTVCDNITINKSNVDFTKLDIKATQYPAII